MESPRMVCAVIVILVALVMLSYKLWHHYSKEGLFCSVCSDHLNISYVDEETAFKHT